MNSRLDPIQLAVSVGMIYAPAADLLIKSASGSYDSIRVGNFSVAQLECALAIRREQERVAAVVAGQVNTNN